MAELKVGDHVAGEFQNGEGITTSRPNGLIVAVSDDKSRVQVQTQYGFLAWLPVAAVKPVDAHP